MRKQRGTNNRSENHPTTGASDGADKRKLMADLEKRRTQNNTGQADNLDATTRTGSVAAKNNRGLEGLTGGGFSGHRAPGFRLNWRMTA
jgi:hypothetical protein